MLEAPGEPVVFEPIRAEASSAPVDSTGNIMRDDLRVAGIVAIAVLAMSAGAAAAKEAPERERDKAEDDDRIVCKKVRDTGSHMRTRVCKTQAQWLADVRPKFPDPRPSEYRDPTTPR